MRMASKATGFAVVVGGIIDVRTVSPTEQAAKVNGLVLLFQVIPSRNASEIWINEAWARKVGESGEQIEVSAVRIETI